MQANKGTIFLDEIGEMSQAMQAKLLRVIQEREIQRVGSEETIQVDVRILAATNVVTLRVPPLRERQDDIPVLAQYFLKQYSEKNRKRIKGFTPVAMDMLLKYDWPGNVRELENAVERAVILGPGDYMTEKELPLSITKAYPSVWRQQKRNCTGTRNHQKNLAQEAAKIWGEIGICFSD
jgi:two-component system response regulator HydG